MLFPGVLRDGGDAPANLLCQLNGNNNNNEDDDDDYDDDDDDDDLRYDYGGHCEMNALARHTALKRWISTETRWYKKAVSRGSAVQSAILLPISLRK